MKRLAPVGWLVLFWALTALVKCQFVLYNGNSAQIVFVAQGLYTALQNTQLSLIIISGNITLTNSTFPEPIIISNRSVELVGDATQATTNVLNFGGLSPAIVVTNNASLSITNLTLSGTGPLNITQPDQYERYKTSGVANWPSLIVEPGTNVTFNETNSYFYSQIAWSQCTKFAAKVQLQLQVAGYGPYVQQPNADTLQLIGDFNITANVTDYTNNAVVGTAFVRSINASGTCVSDPFLQDRYITGQNLQLSSGGGFKWWMGLIIGLAVLIALIAVAIAVWVLIRVRKRRREQQQHQQLPNGQSDGKVSTELSNFPSSGETSAGYPALPPPLFLAGSLRGSAGSSEGKAAVEAGLARGDLRSSGGSSGGRGSGELGSIGIGGGRGSGGVASGSGRRKDSGGQVGSGGPLGSQSSNQSILPPQWSNVAAVLRARSDYSDIELGPLIGRGSFGRVYKGKWKGAFVAIKVVDHQEAASKVIALREGSLSSSVQHPNVVTTYALFQQRIENSGSGPTIDWNPEKRVEAGELEEQEDISAEESGLYATCLVLEYMDRGTLEHAMQSGRFKESASGRPDERAIYRTLMDIAGGMDYLHSVGVLHGDLKGANVLLKSTATDPRGYTCKLADFGLARVLDGDRTHVSTATHGTISYMPAELLRDGRLTRAVDSYSFAILMWELFEGRTLHDGLTMAQVFYKVCYEQARPPVPEHMPAAYAEIMQACWHQEPEQRPTFKEIFRQLRAIREGKNSSGSTGLPSALSSLSSLRLDGTSSQPDAALSPSDANLSPPDAKLSQIDAKRSP